VQLAGSQSSQTAPLGRQTNPISSTIARHAGESRHPVCIERRQ
jgi:hypothetical protein